MSKIAIIGHYGGNNNFTDGQTVKTKEISNYLEKYYNIKVEKFDTYGINKKLLCLIPKIKKIIKNNEVIILIVSRRGYKVIAPIITILNKKYNKKIFDIVIGGTRFNIYNKSNFYRKVANQFNTIFVETNNMIKEYKKRNIYNVKLLTNFKNLKLYDVPKFEKKENIKLCTFCRVIYEKGIEDAINAVKLANKNSKRDIFSLDIYGKIDKNYEKKFYKIMSDTPEFINYKGMVDSSFSSNILSKYDYMLFLTFWNGEGFPGTIIDAFFSNLPVIATDWNCNFEILKDKYTGFKVKINDIESVSKILIKIYREQEKYFIMRTNCYNEAIKYLPDNVMKNFIKEID